MPPSSRRKSKKTNKIKTCKTLTDSTNNHSSLPNVQLQDHCDLIIPLKKEQGSLPPICFSYPYVVVEEKKKGNHSKENSFSVGADFISSHSRMEEPYNVDLKEETQKLESLSEDNKEVVGEVAAYRTETQEQDYESALTDDVHKEHVSESAVDSTLEPVVSSPNEELSIDAKEDAQIESTTLVSENSVESELKKEKEEGSVSHEPEEIHLVKGIEETELPPSEDKIEFSSVPENEATRESEVVETYDKDVKIDEEEEKNVLSSDVVTDVDSKETLETSIIPKSDESESKVPPTTTQEEIPREIEKSLDPSKDEEKVVEVQDPSYESTKDYESSQPLQNVPESESTGLTLPKETEVPRSIENQNNVPEARREYSSWSSCCGIFELLMGGR